MSVEIVFAGFPEELAPNSRPNRWDKAKAIQTYRKSCRIDAQNVRRKLEKHTTFPLSTPVTAYTTFVFTNAHAHDLDNLGASIKALWDGCRDAGVLAADDSKSLHHAPLTVVVDKTLRAPEVRVRLTTGDEA